MVSTGLGAKPWSRSQPVLMRTLLLTAGLPKQVESAVLASSPPQPAPPKPAHPQTANPHSAPALWPRHSKQMANVTALHGGGKKSGQKHPPQAAPPAGFAVKSSPTAPGESMAAAQTLWVWVSALYSNQLDIVCTGPNLHANT